MPASRFTFPPPPRWAFALVALAAFAFLLRVYLGIWTPEHGITKFLRVGQEFDNRGTAVFKATPKFIDPYPAHRWGFDGQLYAEMALDPLLLDPHLHIALDDPPYRAQRILLSWIAAVLGLGNPFWTLNAFAALNLIFWVGFAWLAARLFAPLGWAGLGGYAAMLVTCGIIESMQASLTDLPSFTLILGALMLGGTGGAVVLALAALVRTTSLIGFVGLAELPPPWREAIKKNIVRGLIAAVPVALWVLYVLWRFRGREVGFDGGNLAMPFRGMMEKLGEFSVTAFHGPIRWHRWPFELYKSYDLHALLTIVSVVTQTIFIALHRDWRNPLWRWGAVVAVYFSCISFLSWESHFTITRHALPMTLVFNLLLAARPGRAWLIWFLLGNSFVPFGVRYFDGMREFRSPPPLPEFVIAAPAAMAAKAVEVRYGEGWSDQQWWPDATWRWARDHRTTLIVRNATDRTIRAELRFLATSPQARDLVVTTGSTGEFRADLPAGRKVIAVPLPALPPGETQLTFSVSGDRVKAKDFTAGDVTFKMEAPQLILAAP
ncbi:hypothetical protein [Horticoccus sp. 23ND18S-11]|uniref:hypothetical protein n=1 Tax=Horticoccus sp. 23ND18S-11 TaxID=3391832 RepID=UPI0039C98257